MQARCDNTLLRNGRCLRSLTKVLIIDDDPAILATFRSILRDNKVSFSDRISRLIQSPGFIREPDHETDSIRLRKQWELTCCESGEMAVRIAAEARKQGEPYAMAFVDMRMGQGWDGMKTLRALHQGDRDLQLAICTAYADYSWDEITQIVDRLDGLLVIKKPFDPIEIKQMATAMCSKWQLAKDLKQSMAQLRHERRILQDLVDNSTADVCLTDRDGVFHLVNKRFAARFGTDLDLLGKFCKRYFR